MKQMYFYFKNMKRLTLSSIIIIFLVVEAFSMFPLKFEVSIINAVMIYGYFMIGLMLHAVYEKNKPMVILVILMTNTVGFLLRVWLDWGESSVIQDLNISNILFTYVTICTFIIIGYLYTSTEIDPKKVNSK